MNLGNDWNTGEKPLIYARFAAIFNFNVLKSYLKCWNVNSDKTEFRSQDNIEISAVTLVLKSFQYPPMR